jgi:hypothetical protein
VNEETLTHWREGAVASQKEREREKKGENCSPQLSLAGH